MLIVVSGPSCVGKSFCVDYLTSRHGFKTITPYTTRKPRLSESEGIHYHFRSEGELRHLSSSFSRGYWARPLDSNWYGYSAHIDELPGDAGNWIIQAYSEIALEIKKRHSDVTTVFLDFVSEAAFRNRNLERAGVDKAEFGRRERHAKHEWQRKKSFDFLFQSDNPEVLADDVAKLAFSIAVQSPKPTAGVPGPLTDVEVLSSLTSPDGIRIQRAGGANVEQQVQGWTLDLTLSPKYYRVARRRFLHRIFDLAFSSETDLASRFRESYAAPGNGIRLRTREFILASTNEKIALPANIGGILSGRSSYARLGIAVELSQILLHPGHDDTIPLQITNNLPYPIVLYPDTPVAQVLFMRTTSDAGHPYAEQHRAKYLGHLADLRSRFYQDGVYKTVREGRTPGQPANWDFILNVLLFFLIWALAAAWALERWSQANVSAAAHVVEVAVFLLTTMVGLVRGYRLLKSGQR